MVVGAAPGHAGLSTPLDSHRVVSPLTIPQAMAATEPALSCPPCVQALGRYNIKSWEILQDRVNFACPFHDESNPSCTMWLDRGNYYCLGCGAKGDLIDFVARHEGGDRLKAMIIIRQLAKEPARIEITGLPELAERIRREAASPDAAWSRFHKVDWEKVSAKHPVAAYLIGKRGFQRKTLQAFDVRMTESVEYPVVFPIYQGKDFIGYVKRALDDRKAKYLYNDGFDAESAVAYYKVDGRILLVVEGVLDLMKAAQHGYPHVAALLGWRTTDSKGMWLQAKGVKKVVSALDNTPTGREGTMMMKKWFEVRRFQYPGSYRKDVGDLSQNEFWMGVT